MIILSNPVLKQALSSGRLLLHGRYTGLIVLIGIWFAWLEGVAAMTLLTRGASGKPWFLAASAILAIVFLDVVFGSKARWVIDLTTRQYTWSKGLFPVIVRRSGTLDDFEAVQFHLQDNGSGDRPMILHVLRLRPKTGPEPPTITVSKAHDTSQIEDLHNLARKISAEGGLALESAPMGPPIRSSAAAWKAFLTFGIVSFGWFGGLVWLGQTDMVRGTSFPFTVGQTVTINHNLHGCRVRSFRIMAGSPMHVWVSAGEHGGQTMAESTPYTVTLDLVGTKSSPNAPALVVGLAKSGTDVSTEASSRMLGPGETTNVEVKLGMVGTPPDKLYIRDAE